MKTLLKKLLLIAGIASFATPAFAVTTLKQVQVSGGSEIDLLFDGKVGKNQIKTEFFNDIIQISLTDVAVYPAKISSVNNGTLTKIFAYQYAPKLVRCRFSVKGKAEDYKDRVKVSPSGKILTVHIEDGRAEKADNISLHASAPVRSVAGTAASGAPATIAVAAEKDAKKDEPAKIENTDERALLDRVMAAPIETVPAKSADSGKTFEKENKAARSEKSSAKLTGAKPLPSFFGVFVKLGAVIALFLGIAFLMRRFLNSEKRADAGVVGAIGRYAKNGLGKLGGIAAKEKMIEVLSTHHLGPKKSIVVARVCGRLLVLGVSNESINLISQLSNESELDLEDIGLGSEKAEGPKVSFGAGATAAGPAVFADLLNAEKSRPAVSAPAAARSYGAPAAPQQQTMQQTQAQQQAGVRAQIRSRLEGLKPL